MNAFQKRKYYTITTHTITTSRFWISLKMSCMSSQRSEYINYLDIRCKVRIVSKTNLPQHFQVLRISQFYPFSERLDILFPKDKSFSYHLPSLAPMEISFQMPLLLILKFSLWLLLIYYFLHL